LRGYLRVLRPPRLAQRQLEQPVLRRPDGRIQVTYRGAPLYTFVKDVRPGQTNGEGFKDVGVWHATTVGAAAAAPKPKSSPGYGY